MKADRWTELRIRAFADQPRPRPDGTIRPAPQPEWRPYDQTLSDGRVIKGKPLLKGAFLPASKPQKATKPAAKAKTTPTPDH
jgi:hypothetical protein